MRLAILGERRRLALPAPAAPWPVTGLEPIPLLLESVPLLAAVLRTLLQTRNLRVLLLDVSSQPTDLGLQVLGDPFPQGQAEHSHPRYDTPRRRVLSWSPLTRVNCFSGFGPAKQLQAA